MQYDKIIIQKAIGILQQDGVYAMFLWFNQKSEKDNPTEKFIEFFNRKELKRCFFQKDHLFSKKFKDFCEDLKYISKNLDKLFLLKKIIDRTLIYALYHAKIK